MKHEGLKVFKRSGLWLVLMGLAGCGQSSNQSTDNEHPASRVDASMTGGSRTTDASSQTPVIPEDETRDAATEPPEASTDAGGTAPALSQPAGWDEDIALPLAEDLNPDPHVLEVELEARDADIEILPGQTTRLWTYNGLLPGPLLRAKSGDRLIVHFTNQLPEPTTIHWHGVRVPANMDGTAAMQDPVQPGESFTYDYIIPDAGTYWYHPHMNSSAQVGYGLYAPMIVDDPNDPVVADELVLVFSDISLDESGQLADGDQNGWFGDFFGREGTVLVNGKLRPRLLGRAGVPQRWRIINAARSRYFQMAMPEGELVRIGSDGGLIEYPLPLDRLSLVPSERADLLVTPSPSSDGEVQVLLEDADRFELGILEPPQPLLQFEVTASEGSLAPELPARLTTLPELDLSAAKTRRIELGEATVDGAGYLAINGQAFGVNANPDAGTGADAGASANAEAVHVHQHDHGTDHVAFVGDTEIWEIVNTTDFQHPFHLHGFFFQVLDNEGKPWPVREWKDTVNVPSQRTVRFAVHFDDRPGLWMFHCHILDHAELGMMAVLSVERP